MPSRCIVSAHRRSTLTFGGDWQPPSVKVPARSAVPVIRFMPMLLRFVCCRWLRARAPRCRASCRRHAGRVMPIVVRARIQAMAVLIQDDNCRCHSPMILDATNAPVITDGETAAHTIKPGISAAAQGSTGPGGR